MLVFGCVCVCMCVRICIYVYKCRNFSSKCTYSKIFSRLCRSSTLFRARLSRYGRNSSALAIHGWCAFGARLDKRRLLFTSATDTTIITKYVFIAYIHITSHAVLAAGAGSCVCVCVCLCAVFKRAFRSNAQCAQLLLLSCFKRISLSTVEMLS